MSKWNQYQHGSGQRADNMHVADEIFRLQKQRHQFSDQVMRAARRIKQYIATPADIQIIRNALGKDAAHDVNDPASKKIVGKRNAKKYQDYNRKKWAAEKAAMSQAGKGATVSTKPAVTASTQSVNSEAPAQSAGMQPAPQPVATSTPTPTVAPATQTANANAPQVAPAVPVAPGQSATLNPAAAESFKPATQTANANAPKTRAMHAPATGNVVAPAQATPIRMRASKDVIKLGRQVKGLQGKGAELPTRVDAAMGRALDKIHSAGDMDTLKKFVDGRKNLAKFIRERGKFSGGQLSDITGGMQKVGEYASLLRSGPAGVMGAIGKGVGDIQRLSSNPQFQKLVIQTAGNALKNPKVASAFFEQMSSGAGKIGSALGYIKVATEMVKGIVKTGEWLGGLNMLGENMRGLRSAARLSSADTSHASAQDRELDKLRLQKETRELSGASTLASVMRIARFTPIGWLAEKAFGNGGKTGGELEAEIGARETRQLLDDQHTRIGVEGVHKLAQERIMRDKYGFLGGHLGEGAAFMRKKWLNMPSEEQEKETAAKAKEMINRASALKATMYQRISEGDFKAATEFGKQANQEIGGKFCWLEPQSIFVNMDNARAAARVFPMTQSMRRLRSYE